MDYKQLKKIATPHIREGSNLPSNSFLLLNQLHIPFKNDKQCRDDFKGKYNPLDEHPAFLLTEPNGDKTVYFNSNTMYWNFYIFHEIAHYLLGHEMSSSQNEIDADMLACILAAPIENLPSTIKSARDLSDSCSIPIDKAEMYWQEIKYEIHKTTPIVICTILGLALLFIIIFKHSNDTINTTTKDYNVIESPISTPISTPDTILNSEELYYIT